MVSVCDVVSEAESSHRLGQEVRLAPPHLLSPAQREPPENQHLDLKAPYLCVSAIFSLLFSDLRWVSAGLA